MDFSPTFSTAMATTTMEAITIKRGVIIRYQRFSRYVAIVVVVVVMQP